MKIFILKRLIFSLFLLFVLSFFLFLIIFNLPTDISYALFSRPESANLALKESVNRALGLDKSFLHQYTQWLTNAINLDFGRSMVHGVSVSSLIREKLPYTLALNFSSLVLIAIFSLVFGSLSALKKGKFSDFLITALSFSFISFPSFWLALALIMIFSLHFGFFPSSGIYTIGRDDFADYLWHLALPLFVLVISHLGIYTQIIKNSLIKSLNQPFIKAMRIRGVGEFEVYGCALKHALVPIISFFGANFASLITGSYIVESVFVYPGLGELAINSVIAKDYPVALSVILITAVFAIVGNLAAVVLSAIITRGEKI